MAFEACVFPDRAAAGAALAEQLRQQPPTPPVLVLALPRGGVPVAYEIARALAAPLDVLLVRKVGMPGQPELAIGAVASGDIVVHERSIEQELPGIAADFERIAALERRELLRREQVYRAGRGPLALRGRTVVLVDDGLATGSTMLAAVRAARAGGAARVVVAAPVAAPQAAELVGAEADELIVLQIPAILFAIGQWYDRFEQLEDVEVCRLLELHRGNLAMTDSTDQRER